MSGMWQGVYHPGRGHVGVQEGKREQGALLMGMLEGVRQTEESKNKGVQAK